jgi:hypothetical protein
MLDLKADDRELALSESLLKQFPHVVNTEVHLISHVISDTFVAEDNLSS